MAHDLDSTRPYPTYGRQQNIKWREAITGRAKMPRQAFRQRFQQQRVPGEGTAGGDSALGETAKIARDFTGRESSGPGREASQLTHQGHPVARSCEKPTKVTRQARDTLGKGAPIHDAN